MREARDAHTLILVWKKSKTSKKLVNWFQICNIASSKYATNTWLLFYFRGTNVTRSGSVQDLFSG